MENNYLCKECLHFFYNVVASGKCRKAGDFVSPFQAACKNFKPIPVREKINNSLNSDTETMKKKSYTDIEQSNKLAEILPLESADMSWVSNGLGKPFARTIPVKGDPEELCACWSLAALLGVLPDYTLQTNTDGTVFVVCDSKKPMISDAYDNPIDACYEMIIKRHEQKLL